ncbi:MAG: hypothetical protein ACKO9V_09325, partial [Candidatus Kapaibacterium sp.]
MMSIHGLTTLRCVFFALVLILASSPQLNSQHKRGTALADVSSVKKTEYGMIFTTAAGTMELTVYSPTVIRVHCTKAGQRADKQSY